MVKMNVYLVDGRVYSYDVLDDAKGREHAHRIVTNGWRNTEGGVMCYYPTWQVLKVTFDMQEPDLLAEKYEGV